MQPLNEFENNNPGGMDKRRVQKRNGDWKEIKVQRNAEK